MLALVVTPFNGCEDGAVYPREFQIGDALTGELAVTAISAGWAVPEDANTAGTDDDDDGDAADDNARADGAGDAGRAEVAPTDKPRRRGRRAASAD